MGSYLNPGNILYRGSLRSKIYVDKSLLIARTNDLFWSEQKELMPVPYKFLIILKIRCIQPFFYFNLGTILLCAFMNLKNIIKTFRCIITSQWKQATEARANTVDGTSALCIKKNTFFFFSFHSQMRQDISVCHSQFQYTVQQFFRCMVQSSAQATDIIWIQHNRISHSLTAVVAAFAVLTVCFHHIVSTI